MHPNGKSAAAGDVGPEGPFRPGVPKPLVEAACMCVMACSRRAGGAGMDRISQSYVPVARDKRMWAVRTRKGTKTDFCTL